MILKGKKTYKKVNEHLKENCKIMLKDCIKTIQIAPQNINVYEEYLESFKKVHYKISKKDTTSLKLSQNPKYAIFIGKDGMDKYIKVQDLLQNKNLKKIKCFKDYKNICQ